MYYKIMKRIGFFLNNPYYMIIIWRNMNIERMKVGVRERKKKKNKC